MWCEIWDWLVMHYASHWEQLLFLWHCTAKPCSMAFKCNTESCKCLILQHDPANTYQNVSRYSLLSTSISTGVTCSVCGKSFTQRENKACPRDFYMVLKASLWLANKTFFPTRRVEFDVRFGFTELPLVAFGDALKPKESPLTSNLNYLSC